MTSTTPTSSTTPSPDSRRWLILAVLGLAQLMVVLDATIVNIALPSAQKALGFSDDSRQWIITAYALSFGSLLLLGGRIGDFFGRKWTFIAGLVGFAVPRRSAGSRRASRCWLPPAPRRERSARCWRRPRCRF
jgi:MFS family permease